MTKTYLVAIYPSGREYRLRRARGVWWWDDDKGSHPLSAAIEDVKEQGGKIERRAYVPYHGFLR